MSDYTVTGKINTVVPLILMDYQDIHGKWRTIPSSTISIGNNQDLFNATNRSWSEVPPEGWCKYKTTKGSVFTFYFFDGYSEENFCKTTIEVLNEKLSAPTPEYPRGSKTWTVTYYINAYSNQIGITDVPVLCNELLNIPEYDFSSEKDIKNFFGDREYICLKDVFAMSRLAPGDKIWFSTQPQFLTPESKLILLRELAEISCKELSDKARSNSAVLDKLLSVNKDSFADDAASLSQSLDKMYTDSKDSNNQRDCELIGSMTSLLNANFENGWKNAVNSYLGRAYDKELAKRQETIVQLVEKHL